MFFRSNEILTAKQLNTAFGVAYVGNIVAIVLAVL